MVRRNPRRDQVAENRTTLDKLVAAFERPSLNRTGRRSLGSGVGE